MSFGVARECCSKHRLQDQRSPRSRNRQWPMECFELLNSAAIIRYKSPANGNRMFPARKIRKPKITSGSQLRPRIRRSGCGRPRSSLDLDGSDGTLHPRGVPLQLLLGAVDDIQGTEHLRQNNPPAGWPLLYWCSAQGHCAGPAGVRSNMDCCSHHRGKRAAGV
jgi:hypothetical protein